MEFNENFYIMLEMAGKQASSFPVFAIQSWFDLIFHNSTYIYKSSASRSQCKSIQIIYVGMEMKVRPYIHLLS